MSRKKEVEKSHRLLLENTFCDSESKELITIGILSNIDVSLAMMCDKFCNSEDESDMYMHDMNLINYIFEKYLVFENGSTIKPDIEDVYKGWERRMRNGQ